MLDLILSLTTLSMGVSYLDNQVLENPFPAAFQEKIYRDDTFLGNVVVSQKKSGAPGQETVTLQKETTLRMNRYGSPVEMKMIEFQEMTQRGQITKIGMYQFQNGKQVRSLTCRKEGASLRTTLDGARELIMPWVEDGFGPLGMEQMLQGRTWKDQDYLEFSCYLPVVNRFVTIEAKSSKLSPMNPGENGKWLVTMTPKKIEGTNLSLQLPSTRYFLDDQQKVLHSNTEMDGIGEIQVLRNGSLQANQARKPSQPFDIGKSSLIPLNRVFRAAKTSTRASYRLTPTTGTLEDLRLLEDERLKVSQRTPQSMIVDVKAYWSPEEYPASPPPSNEEMAPSRFIDWDHPAIRAFSQTPFPKDQDSWRRAIQLEKWVRNKMNFNSSVPFAPASEIARGTGGDCRNAAVLLAAVLRAEGIPSRIAHGLVYVEKNGQPYLGFHMWTEAYVRGRWWPLDATQGLGVVGADHIKLSQDTYHGVDSSTPMVVVQSYLGKIKVSMD